MAPKSRRVPKELRQRTEHSCDRCKSRKQKCLTWPGEEKCRHCQKYGYDCVVTKPRKQRLYGSVETHSARVAVLESLVKGLVPEADLSNVESMQEMARSLGIPLPETVSTADTLSRSGSATVKEDENEQLVHDLQGQGQYIGKASSYFFQMKLRTLVGKMPGGGLGRMYLFGPNPASSRRRSGTIHTAGGDDEPLDMHSIASTVASPSNDGLVSADDAAPAESQSVVFLLVRIFFDRINVDFPILHEATFLERLDGWCKDPSSVDDVWLCSFLCVLILSRRLCDVHIPEAQEEAWWCRIQSLLSTVMFTSSLTSIQALMLAALHLHNTNSRDICWTLTGAAIRIGFAIGLHRDGIDTQGTPLTREMRKRVWWTLYAFEQLQVSSHDRPSAIDNPKYLPNPPRETILDMGTHNLPDYVAWSNRLVVMLGAACRTLPDAAKDGYSGPLSPAAGLLRELSRWRTGLPQHLSMDSIDAMPPTFQRPLILLHIQYHYVVSLISRYALLSRFTTLSRDRATAVADSLLSMSDVCIESGRLSCQLLLKLDLIDSFNAVSWLDVYYLYSSTLVLALSIICHVSQGKRDATAEHGRLLYQCTDLAARHLRNPLVPGTMRRWLTVVGELKTMVDEFSGKHSAAQQNSASAAAAASRDDIAPCVADYGGGAMQLSLPPPHEGLTDKAPALVVGDRRQDLYAASARPRLPEVSEGSARVPPFFPSMSSPPVFGYEQPLHPHPDGLEARFWPEMHWEGISDMLLGMEPRTWNM
ncbi:Fungal-specific transcription factor domain-containing protein [Pleurostoma richardsiae]|uniref:Fungal-specific transcription factor domain-containing protein n=1 Tax=Pleurostoma richardsiae TaxID=41990 RepID=A0AA38S808_9PEZI|nr:Fungal-specific transcription factor domain-containing protein [Pleurostoma richardsiae]